MKQVYSHHVILIMKSKDVRIIAFCGSNSLPFHQILNRADQIAILGCRLILLLLRRTIHTSAQRTGELCLPSFEKQLHVVDSLSITIRRGEVFHARPQAAFDVVLQTRPRVVPREVQFAGGDQKAPMNEVHGAVGEISRKVRAVVHAAVLFEAACNKDFRKSTSERELYIGIGFVITQQDVEARLLLLNEVIFERQRLALRSEEHTSELQSHVNLVCRLLLEKK